MNKEKIILKFKRGRPSGMKNRHYQFQICVWLAMNKSTRQIIDLLENRFSLKMSFANLDNNYRYGKKWHPIISYIRNRYLKNISRIPIANKAHRLRMLDEAAEETLTWYKKSVNQYGEIQEKKIGVLPQLINEARKEVEGEKPFIDASSHLHFTTIKEAIENASNNGKPRDRILESLNGAKKLAG